MGVNETREAFRAGFLAVCSHHGKPDNLAGYFEREWTFDGVAAADLEPEAWEAYRSSLLKRVEVVHAGK